MKLTTNYNLKKPEGSDVVNIDDFNYNANVIDNALLQNKNDILNIIEVTNIMGSEIEALKDSEKVTDIKGKVTFLNGWNFWGDEERFSAFIVGNMVKICILLAPGTRTMYTPIFKIPTEYVPTTKEYITCSDQANGCYVGCLDADGLFAFEVNILDESKWTNVNITYPLRKKVF